MSDFEKLAQIVRQRRSARTVDMNGKQIPDTVIEALLELANWAPTHARTEPWRFLVYTGDAKNRFCADHAALYQAVISPEQFLPAKYNKLLHQGDAVSHIIVVFMQPGEPPRVPLLEEIAATAAAIQNILLGAEAAGISTLWSTGGMAHHPAMKEYLALPEAAQLMGILYLGYTDNIAYPAKRNIPLTEKIRWYR